MIIPGVEPNGVPWQPLAALMSEISEEHWCAGWDADLEFRLWRQAQGAPFVGGDWSDDVCEDDRAQLRRLSAACGGWVYWKSSDDGQWREGDGRTFIPLAEWLVMFDEHKAKDR